MKLHRVILFSISLVSVAWFLSSFLSCTQNFKDAYSGFSPEETHGVPKLDSNYKVISRKAKEDVPQEIKSILEKNKNKSIQSVMNSPESREILLHTMKVYEILETRDKDLLRYYFPAAVHIIDQLSFCLSEKELCGHRKEVEDLNDYFNPKRTILHQAVKASLLLIKRALIHEQGSIHDIPLKALEQNLSIDGSEIPILASQILLLDKYNFERNYNIVLEASSKMEANTKVSTLIMLSLENRSIAFQANGFFKRFSKILRETLTDSSDIYTAFTAFKNLNRFNLPNKDFLSQAHEICKIKSALKSVGSWIPAYVNLRDQSQERGLDLKLPCI